MKPYHKIKNVRFLENKLSVVIDGVHFSFNIQSVSKKLFNASKVERENFKISPSGYGITWPLLDEDISVDGLLKIRHKQKTTKRKKAVF